MLLNCAVFGALFRPLKPTRVKMSATTDNPAIEVKTTLLSKGHSTTSLHASQPMTHRFFGTNNNTEYPTAAQVLGSSPDIVTYVCSSSLNNLSTIMYIYDESIISTLLFCLRRSLYTRSTSSSRSLHSLHKVVELRNLERQVSSSEKRLSVPIYPELEVVNDDELKSVEEENNLLDGDAERLKGRVPTVSITHIKNSSPLSIVGHKIICELYILICRVFKLASSTRCG